jgi:hypothetical protein
MMTIDDDTSVHCDMSRFLLIIKCDVIIMGCVMSLAVAVSLVRTGMTSLCLSQADAVNGEWRIFSKNLRSTHRRVGICSVGGMSCMATSHIAPDITSFIKF